MSERIGYLGPDGTYSHLVTQTHYSNAVLQGYPSFIALFDALKQQKLTHSIVPIENSIEGPVSAIMDLLVTHKTLYITEEIKYAINHCLLVKPGVSHTEIQTIMSHSQGLAQCQHYSYTRFPTAKQIPVESTALAAQTLAATTDRTVAIIGSRELGALYQLDCIDQAINDVSPNITRFIRLSHQPATRTGHDKTSLIITPTHNQPGILAETLMYFAQAGINLTRIESRPARPILGHYIFYLDFDGHYTDPTVQTILGKLGDTYHLLGSYPVASDT